MDLTKMIDLFSQLTNKSTENNQEQPASQPPPTTNENANINVSTTYYPETLEVKQVNNKNESTHIFPQDIYSPNKTQQNIQKPNSTGFSLPFNLNPEMLKLIQQVLPLFLNNNNEGNNLLSGLLSGKNPLASLFSTKKKSPPTVNETTESVIDEYQINNLIRIDDN